MYVRINRGTFDPSKAQGVLEMLRSEMLPPWAPRK